MKEKLYPLRLYARQPAVLTSTIIAIVVNFITLGWLAWSIRPQEELLFLHYNILFGVDFIGEWWKVYYLPISGFLIIVLNFFVGWLLFHKDKFIAKLLQAVSVFCQMALLLAAALLVFLNV